MYYSRRAIFLLFLVDVISFVSLSVTHIDCHVCAGVTRKRVLNTPEHKRSIRSKNYQEGVGVRIKDRCGHGVESKALRCHKFSEAMRRRIFANIRRIGHEGRRWDWISTHMDEVSYVLCSSVWLIFYQNHCNQISIDNGRYRYESQVIINNSAFFCLNKKTENSN